MIPGFVIAPPAAVRFRRISPIEVTPAAEMAEASIIVIGLAVSISERLIREPVTSIRSTACSAPSSAEKTEVATNLVAAAPTISAKRMLLAT